MCSLSPAALHLTARCSCSVPALPPILQTDSLSINAEHYRRLVFVATDKRTAFPSLERELVLRFKCEAAAVFGLNTAYFNRMSLLTPRWFSLQ